MRDGEAIAPFSFDSGRVGTAQDFGYSSDIIGQPISYCVSTEFLTLSALQRFALQPDAYDFFHLSRDISSGSGSARPIYATGRLCRTIPARGS